MDRKTRYEYVMFYIVYKTVNEASICIAKSDNGIGWVRSDENPIVTPTVNTFDQSSCYKPSVVYDEDNDEWRMWYNGRNGNSEYIGLCIKKVRSKPAIAEEMQEKRSEKRNRKRLSVHCRQREVHCAGSVSDRSDYRSCQKAQLTQGTALRSTTCCIIEKN